MRRFSPFVPLLFFLLSSSITAQPSLQNGKRLYEGACLPCHGADGDGNGLAAKGLNPKPKDLTTGWYKFRSTPHGQMPTDEDILKTISQGVPRTTMPAFEQIFDEDEILDIVEYLKTFTDRFERWGPGDPIQIPTEIPLTPETVAEGKRVYQALRCWECHGQNGRGKGPISSELKDDMDNPIKAFDFTVGKYKAGSTNREIYKTFNTGLSGTPMGTYLDAFLFTKEDFKNMSPYEKYLSEAQLNDLLAYISTLPAKEEVEALRQEEREELANGRRWALVHFVKSLSRKRGWFHKLFVEDVEVTK
jgi:mono/diheme cytochrome c family protein